MDELGRLSVKEFKETSKIPLVIILDNVRSMHNVGSIFRTADGFAVERLLLCGITGQPPHREIEKTALGATQSVDWSYHSDVEEAVVELQSEGYIVCAVEQARGSVALHDFSPNPDRKYAFVFGNEVHGVTGAVMKRADQCIEIPQFGTKHSFNISVATGIILWDFYCKMLLDVGLKP